MGRPSCVNVSSRRRARGNSLPAAASAREQLAGRGERPAFVRRSGRVREVGADLDQLRFAGRVPGEEVDLVAFGGPHVGHVAAPALELEEDHRLQRMVRVAPTGTASVGSGDKRQLLRPLA